MHNMIDLESTRENNREEEKKKTLNFINNNLNDSLTASRSYIAYKYSSCFFGAFENNISSISANLNNIGDIMM